MTKVNARLFSASNFKNYFRELSIVIIGVLITILITNGISNYNRQQEAKEILKLVKTELIENLSNLQEVQRRWEGEQRIFNLLRQNQYDLQQIPADTLNKYDYAIGALYNISVDSESFELLKNSLLIQYVKDKNILYNISMTYKNIQVLQNQLTTYTEQKKSIFLEPFLAKTDEEGINKWIYDDNRVSFAFLIGEKEFMKFISISGTILSPPSIFEDCKSDLRKIIGTMEKKGY